MEDLKMKRLMMVGALLGALVFGAASTSQAYVYVRPVPRVAARAVLPPYGRPWVGPRYSGYYGARFYGPGYYRPYYRPGYYGYRGWGPGFYGPGLGVGVGIY
jgi:hypothetical protein